MSSSRGQRLLRELSVVGDHLDRRVRLLLDDAIARGDVPSRALDEQLEALVREEPTLAAPTLAVLRTAPTLYRSTWTALASATTDPQVYRPDAVNPARLHPLMAICMALAAAVLVLHRCG